MRYFLLLLVCVLFTVPAVPADVLTAMDQADLFINHTASGEYVKCGTPQLYWLLHDDSPDAAAFRAKYVQLARPNLDGYADSKEGHFRVHFSLSGNNAPDLTDADANGVPDYVDSTLVYLEYAWETDMSLGYGAPKSDSGRGGRDDDNKDLVDVYLEDLSVQGYYGYTSPDTNSIMDSSYMVLDNNYTDSIYSTKGYSALKVTTAHEFFHVIHFSYYGGTDAVWWMEQSAVWMEDYTWDDVNDYLNYVSDFIDNRETSLNTGPPSSFMYSATLFAFMIAKKHGADTIRKVWNAFRNSQSGNIELFNTILPGTLSQALSDLGVWTYFTGDRANSSAFFTDSPLIRKMASFSDMLAAIPETDSVSCRKYTFKYIGICPPGGLSPGDSLSLSFTERTGGSWKKQVILYNSAYDYELLEIDEDREILTVDRSFDEAVMVVSNAGSVTGRIVYSLSRASEEVKPIPLALEQNRPNPFNGSTTIRFSVPESVPVKIRVVNVLGQTVRTLVNEVREQGTYNVAFDASGLSSGLYFAVLESPGAFISRKMLLLR